MQAASFALLTLDRTLVTRQKGNEWTNIQQVNDAIHVDVRLGIETTAANGFNERTDVQQVDYTIAIDITNQSTNFDKNNYSVVKLDKIVVEFAAIFENTG